MSHTMFTRVPRTRTGYDPQEVEEFLERARESYNAPDGEVIADRIDDEAVRAVTFNRVSGGYDWAEVDAALDRLEQAFIQQRRAAVMSTSGSDDWMNRAADMAKTLYPRMLRPEGERFAEADGRGYHRDDVDECVDQLARYFDGETEMSANDVRSAAFRVARGSKAYDFATVDAYLDRAVQVLLAVE